MRSDISTPSSVTPLRSVLSTHERPGRQQLTDELIARLHDATVLLTDEERSQLVADVVLANVSVATRIARRFDGRGCALEDLEQTAYVALIMAVQRFDPTLGNHFLSYVVPCITGEVRKHFRDLGWMVRPPRPVQELQSLVEREQLRPDPATGLPPSEDDLAQRLAVPVQLVRQARAARGCFTPSSLDRPVLGSTEAVLGDTLLDERSTTSYDAAEARVVLAPALSSLSPAGRHLVQRRFVDEWTQHDIGVELGLSQPQVSRLLAEVLRGLRQSIDGPDLGESRSA